MERARGPTPPPGWYADPGGRYRSRRWSGERWTADVVASGVRIRRSPPNAHWAPPSPDAVRDRAQHERRVSRWVLLATAAAVFIALAIAGYAVLDQLAHDYDEAATDTWTNVALVAEMDRWTLPPSVAPYQGWVDDEGPGLVERRYSPAAGVTVARAAEDLANTLRERYPDLESVRPGVWSGSCRAEVTCRVLIEADDANGRIVVTLTA